MYSKSRLDNLEILPKLPISKENFMLSSLFKRLTKKAQTPETAEWLDRTRLPFFMKIVGHYEVVVGPKPLDYEWVSQQDYPDRRASNQCYLYGVRNMFGNGPIFYFASRFGNLPRGFWVRMVTVGYSYYEYIPLGDESYKKSRYPSEDDLVAA